MTVIAVGLVMRAVTETVCPTLEPWSWEWILLGCMGWILLYKAIPVAIAGVLAFGAARLVRRRLA